MIGNVAEDAAVPALEPYDFGLFGGQVDDTYVVAGQIPQRSERTHA